MLIMLVETVHAIVREVMLAPAIGDLRARQWGVLVGSILVLTIVCALSGWLRATTRRVRWMLGGYWVALTVVFEVLVGRVTNQTWSRVLANYNPAEGGFMVLGLLVMFLAPWVAAEWLKYWRK